MTDHASTLCDCHAHIFGDRALYPLAPNANYAPTNATVNSYRDLLEDLAIERCVLVQPSIYGTDNRCMLDALRVLGPRARGIAVIAPDTDDAQLEEMHRLGVRGIRLNTLPAGGPSLDRLPDLEQRVHPLNWHVQILLRQDNLLADFEKIAKTSVTIVLDHFASFSPGSGEEELDALFHLASKKDIWIKLSAPYLFSDCSSQDLAYYARFVDKALQVMPDRLLWASDWPHPALKNAAIGTRQLKELLSDWVPCERLRARISMENPKRLYGF